MKKTMSLVLAAAAVAMTLASCTKELNGNNEENNQTSDLRTLTIGFADSDTRTTLSGLQPVWAKGDQITISNGSTTEPVNVPDDAEGKTSFTVTTSLKGSLTVYYPGGDKYDTYWSNGDVKIPASQTGEFADANVCSGSVNEDGSNLTLYNRTAIIKVIVPADTKTLTLTSLNPIDDSGQRASSGAAAIADDSATTITVGNGSSNIPNPCYVSILAGNVLLQDLNVDVDDKAQGGFSPNAIVAKGKTHSSYAVEANTIYTLSKESLHDYVKVDGKKWATMNVGASSPTEYGDYFAWGETTGHAAATNGENAFVSGFTDNSKGFSWSNAPFNNYQESYDEIYFGSVKDTVCPNGVLALAYDAAFCNWGGAWRMPTSEEFVKLISTTNTGDTNYGEGFLTINGHPSLIFPAAGFGGSEKSSFELSESGTNGYFWASTFYAGKSAYTLTFDSDMWQLIPGYFTERSRGRSVRPVSE